MEMQLWRDSRDRAETATRALQDALDAAGVPERVWRSIRSVVTRHGRPFVDIGPLPPEVAERLAEALRQPPPETRWLDTGSSSGVMIPVPPGRRP
ncbi:hypothetical protein [Streptomyces sp. NPDC001985]|uniref:hypothetical protein n=1 Tax=Streptomyces sp. NPDC001985 TaxID=3154406 RepID=UPI0033168370